MSDAELTSPGASTQKSGTSGPTDARPAPQAAHNIAKRRWRWSRGEIIQLLIAVFLAVGVVVLALDMKFQADQARWMQRQTCLEWYRMQADYGVGPWYQKLPAAAADCGGQFNDAGDPLVPGGTGPAVEPGEKRYVRPGG